MGLEREFLAMASTTVTIAPQSSGYTLYGAPSFGTAVTYVARVEPETQLVRNSAGQEIRTKFRVFVMSSSATVGVSDRITAAGTTELSIFSVEPLHDEEGLHHLELLLV